MRYYYAVVEPDTFGNFVCVGTIDTFARISRNNYIQLDSQDDSLLGRIWVDGIWMDNPNAVPNTDAVNPAERQKTTEEVILESIDQLQAKNAELESLVETLLESAVIV